MRDEMERDNVSLGQEYLLYVEIFQRWHACLLTNGAKYFIDLIIHY